MQLKPCQNQYVFPCFNSSKPDKVISHVMYYPVCLILFVLQKGFYKMSINSVLEALEVLPSSHLKPFNHVTASYKSATVRVSVGTKLRGRAQVAGRKKLFSSKKTG